MRQASGAGEDFSPIESCDEGVSQAKSGDFVITILCVMVGFREPIQVTIVDGSCDDIAYTD